jgi:RNA polymerase-binding transcription factor DksA
MIKDDFEYNNEEEAEMAQIHSLHINMNAVARVQAELAKQAQEPSLSECEECGEDIPVQRQRLIPGVRLCVHCKERQERR